MSLMLNKQYASTQLYNKFLNKKQSYKGDLTNNSNFQYNMSSAKSDLYSTNMAFTGYAIRILRDKNGKLGSELFQTTKSRSEINKLLNNLGNLDDSVPEQAEKLENTKKEIEELLKNREIIEISVNNLAKPFKKLLSSQPEKVKSGSELVKWLIDLDILPQIPDMNPIYRNLLENKETVNPLMEFIGYLADGNKLKKIPDNVIVFIRGKAKFGKPEEMSMADDTLNKLRKSNLIIKDDFPNLMSENASENRLRVAQKEKLLTDNIGDVLTGLKSEDPDVAFSAMDILKGWIKDGSINNKNNLISVDNIKEFFNLVKKDDDVSQQVGLTIIDSLANYNNKNLRQVFEKDVNVIEPILAKFDPEIYKLDSEEELTTTQKIAIKVTHKLIQNNYVKIIPERHAEVIAKRLDPKYIKTPKRDIPKMGHTLKTVRKLVSNYIKKNKSVNFIPQENVQYVLNLTHHPQKFIKKESLNITKNLLKKTDLIESISDEDFKGILKNLCSESDSYILNYSLSIIRSIVKKDIKNPDNFVTQAHVKRIFELTNDPSDYVSCSAIDTVNMLLEKNSQNMKNSIEDKTVGNLINKLNHDNPDVVFATMRLIETLDNVGLLKESSNQKAMFRNQQVNQADYVKITSDTLESIKEKLNLQNEDEKFYYQKTINILQKYGFIS